MIEQKQIKVLYDKYFELIKLEVKEFGVKPTEVRHLIGRLGEFFCAIETGGKLAHEPNQHGFDVISSSGRRISVKTTAQKTGFVTISANTVKKVDEIMILQYIDESLKIIYWGDVNPAIQAARIWKDKFELDISKARKLITGK